MKIDRLIGIIMLLSNRGRMTAGELSTRYEVSIKTIHRDLEAINRAGVPIIGYQGKDGGYEISENYRIDRSVLSRRENSWITQLLENLSKNFPLREFAACNEKFGDTNPSNAVDQKIIFDFSCWDSNNKLGQKLQTIETALHNRFTLQFTYRNQRNECLNRCIEPSQLIFRGVHWYLCGWCLIRKDYRLFKVRRMGEIEIGEPFSATHNSPPFTHLFHPWLQNSEAIRFHITNQFKIKLDDYFDDYTLDGNIAEILWPIDDWVAALFLGFGTEVEVLEPPLLRELMCKKILELSKLYLNQNSCVIL